MRTVRQRPTAPRCARPPRTARCPPPHRHLQRPRGATTRAPASRWPALTNTFTGITSSTSLAMITPSTLQAAHPAIGPRVAHPVAQPARCTPSGRRHFDDAVALRGAPGVPAGPSTRRPARRCPRRIRAAAAADARTPGRPARQARARTAARFPVPCEVAKGADLGWLGCVVTTPGSYKRPLHETVERDPPPAASISRRCGLTSRWLWRGRIGFGRRQCCSAGSAAGSFRHAGNGTLARVDAHEATP